MFSKSRDVLIVFLSLLMLGGCGKCGNKCKHFLKENSTKVSEKTKIKVKEVDIFVDVTKSMAGFARGDAEVYKTLFSKGEGLIEELQSLYNLNVDNIKYYKFTDEITEIDYKTFTDSLVNRGYYTGLSNDYTVVFDHILEDNNQKSKLYIVITDLFQSDRDLNRIHDALREIAEKGLSVGIVGFKDFFDGVVYDIEGVEPYRYRGYRNFYLLLIGSDAAITKFISPNDTKKSRLSPDEFILFTPNPINMKINNIKGIKGGNGAYCIKVKSRRIKRLGYIKINIESKKGSFVNAANYRKFITFEARPYRSSCCSRNAKIEGKILTNNASLDVNQLIKLTNNYNTPCLSVILSPKEETRITETPEWVEDWNMEVESGEVPDSEKGDTFGLQSLVRRLYNIYLRVMKKEVIHVLLH